MSYKKDISNDPMAICDFEEALEQGAATYIEKHDK